MNDRAERRRAELKLRKLYAKIPTFKCIEGCTKCCGVVPWSAPEFNKLGDKGGQHPIIQVHEGTVTPMRSDGCMDCPFYSDQGCTVYEDRPFMCRLYGTVENLPCVMGQKPAKMLSAQRGGELVAEYMAIVQEHPAELPSGIKKVKIFHHGDGNSPALANVIGVTP